MFKAFILSMWIANGADAGTSLYAFHYGARERNPLVVSTKPAPFLAESLAFTAGETYLAVKLHKHHPKWTNALLAAHISFEVYLVAHNINIARQLRP